MFIRNCSTQFFKSRRKNSKKMAAIYSIIVVNSKNLMFPKQKTVFLKSYSGHVECSFAVLKTTPKRLNQELERSLLNVQKSLIENSQFLQKKVFIRIVPWKWRLQFRNLCPNISEGRPKFSTQAPILIRKRFSSQERNPIKRFLCTHKMHFWKSRGSSLAKGRELVA